MAVMEVVLGVSLDVAVAAAALETNGVAVPAVVPVAGAVAAVVLAGVSGGSLPQRAEEHLGVPRVERNGDVAPETAQDH